MDKQFTDKDYELITQLLDGELSGEQAAEVEQLISENPELQLEMDRQAEISRAIQNDTESFVPPRTAKDNIFLALGIPLAVSAPTVATISSEGGNLVSLVAAFAATLMTFTMFYGLNSTDEKSTPINSNIPIVSSVETAHNNNIIILDKAAAADNAHNSLANKNTVADNTIINTTPPAINRVIKSSSNNSINNLNTSANLSDNISENTTTERKIINQSWSANIITSKNNSFSPNGNIFLQGNELTPNNTILTRDYLTVIRTISGSKNLNSGSFDISFLTNYIVRDVRGIMSAGLSWYDVNSAVQLRNPVFFGGGIEYTPTFMELFANEYFDTFANGQLFIGKTPSYKLEAGLSTNLGGLVNFPIVIGYSKTYVRDYQFIQLESNENFFIGTEIIF